MPARPLAPLAVSPSPVNTVPHLPLGGGLGWTLSEKSAVDAINLQRQGLVDAHGIDESIGADCGRRARAEDPIADLSRSTDDRLADRQGAGTEEWVRGKAGIVADDIGKEAQAAVPISLVTPTKKEEQVRITDIKDIAVGIPLDYAPILRIIGNYCHMRTRSGHA